MGKLFHQDAEEKCWDESAIEAKMTAAQTVAEEQEQLSLPKALFRSVVVQGLIAAGIVLICSCLTLATKRYSYLVGFIFAAYLAYDSVNLVFDYKNKLIHQRVLLCSSVNRNFMGRQIIMQDFTVEPAVIYEFFFPKKGSCPFVESGVYIIYTHDKDPKRIVSWLRT